MTRLTAAIGYRMRRAGPLGGCLALAITVPGLVHGQSAPTPDLEPAVRTSSSAATAPAAASPATTAPAAAPAAAARAAPRASKPTPAAGHSKDSIQLETTEISGNRELPKVMYIVPWRRADIGDLVGRPPNSLLDEALAPVDRDVFRRQNRYYAALQAGAASKPAEQPAGAGGTAGSAGVTPIGDSGASSRPQNGQVGRDEK